MPLCLGFPRASFTPTFPPITFTRSILTYSCYMVLPFRPSPLDHSTYTWWRLQIAQLLVMHFVHPPASSSLFSPNIFLGTIFSNILSLCSSLNVRNQFSHPYRSTGKIIALYILMFTFFDSR
jgi:hypothetical protein